MVEKLSFVRPVSLGQASRIPGVTPAAISIVRMHLRRGVRADAHERAGDATSASSCGGTRRINLIGPEAKENIDAHIDEAVIAAEILKPSGDVLDFGSGGGLPAIPMAIVSPEARFHLVEADKKKWAFLKHIVRACELNAVIYGDRLARARDAVPA